MSENTKKPGEDDTSPAPPLPPVSPDAPSEPQTKPESQLSNYGADAVPEVAGDDPTEFLKQRLEETRLPPHLKEQFLAELPPKEERERMYREMQENCGLSFEQFCVALGIEVKPTS